MKIEDDDVFRMRPEALAAAIADDRAKGYLPLNAAELSAELAKLD